MKTNNMNVSLVNIPADLFETMWNAAISNAPKKLDMVASETVDLDWNDLPTSGQLKMAEMLTAVVVSAAFIQYEKQYPE